MSTHRSVITTCDAHLANNCEGTYDALAMTATESRQYAREDGGWHVNRPGGRDICPACWDEGAR